ncbi:type II toxin-antitoxin system VapC family toxin [Candidatus Sneabacter namystus]|uniref:Type II toxin-antitoxin system VapC family toxin n=1 Tax=Candidatus Sneabacter namystus TaxID=2601646 RepID=A0A5C0UJU2_9RICK|nr:type II toxin-antitoxin system VapC family toxin [Candidatus Sneabacter namystus]QEK39891.1 type II toxin-antitoxin system VapC family toxin [Candidatus Sneabacter namystus]
MQKMVVLDSSAVIALLEEERGHEVVQEHMQGALISSINVAEIFKYILNEKKLSEQDGISLLDTLGIKMINFDYRQAWLTATLSLRTRHKGLSLGDRACIALGMVHNLPVLTCDRIWQECELDVKIIAVR